MLSNMQTGLSPQVQSKMSKQKNQISKDRYRKYIFSGGSGSIETE